MKNHTKEFQWEVSELLEEVTVEEAHQAIMRRLDRAFESLDPQAQELLSDYFEGSTLKEIGKKHSLSTDKTQDLIHQIKRQLLSHLQRNHQARH